jgi:hypothetical protein
MNMVKERMVTLGFNKENLRNPPTPSSQQSQRQPIKATPPKAKRAKLDLGGGSTSYSTKQSGEDKCSKCGGFHKKKDCPNPPQAITSNPNPSQPCSHCYAYGHDVDHCFTFHPRLWQGQSQNTNASKGQGFGKGQKGKGVTNKRPANEGPTTKLVQGQPNTMEARFTLLEAQVTIMVA